MSRVPNGVPTVTYCRLMPSTVSMSQGDVMADGNAVVVLEPGQPSSRFEVAQVLDKSHSDEEICDLTFGSRAGAGLGAVLNPVAAFVNDAANVVIMLTGSRMTKKWQFLKRCFLPFVANEILTAIAERSQQAPNNFYKAQLTLSTFEIHDEVIGDLLRPANRGLPIVNTLEDGVVVQGLHKETIVDEVTLRRLLAEACDNRATYGLPVGGNIDTSTGVFEFRLYQAEPQGQGQNVFQTQECYSKLTIIDVPSMDPLASTNPEELRLLSGPTLHKSLLCLLEVCKKLNNPYRAQLAPFRSSKLTHYLSEMLGGNAIVVALAQVCSGEPHVSRRTLDFLSYLNSAVHYPMGAREFSDTIRGLLGKYRAMLMHLSDELHNTASTSNTNTEQQTSLTTKLQAELAKCVTEMNSALEDRARIFEMSELLKAKYNTLMEEKLKQAEDLAQSEEDNIALAKEVVENELAHAQEMEKAEKEKLGLQGDIVTLEAQVESLTADLADFKEKCRKLEQQVVDDANEVANKQSQIEDLFQQLQARSSELSQQKEKNIELGAELLTLVNHKDVLHKDLDDLQVKNKNIDAVMAEHQSKHKEAELEIRKLLEKLVSKDEEIIELRKFKYMKQQGKDNMASTASLEQPDPTNASVTKAVESMRLAVDQKKERQFAKQIQSLERQLRRMEADYQSSKKERDQAVKEVTDLRSKYRSLLQDSYNSAQQGQQPDGHASKDSGGIANNNDADDPLAVLHVHHNLQSLLSSYQSHESILEDSYGQAVQTRQEAIEAYRQLYDHYRHSLDMVEDMMSIVQEGKYSGTSGGSSTGRDNKDSSGGGKKMQLEVRAKKILEESLAEQFQFGSTVIPNAEKLLNEMEDPRSKFGKKDLPGLDKDRNDVDMKERIAAVIGTYQHSLQQTENKLAHAMQENMELKVQVKQLLSSNPGSMSKQARQDTDTHSVKSEAVTDAQYKQALDQQTTQLTQQYKVMYENFSKEILALKNELVTTKQREQSLQQALSRGQSQNVSRVPSAAGEPGLGLDVEPVKDAAPSSRAQAIIADVLEKKYSVPMLTLPSVRNDVIIESQRQQQQQQQQEALSSQTPQVQPVNTAAVNPPPEHHHHQAHHHHNAQHAVVVKKLEEEKQQLRTQLLLSEQRAAQMSAQQVSLQEELAAYQTYMKDILPQYQRMLQQQKKTAQGLSSSLLALNSGGLGAVGGPAGVGGVGIAGATAARPSVTSMAAAKEVLRSNSNSNMK